MSEGPERKVKYIRKRNDPSVYKATKILLSRGDMFACNRDGSFITTGVAEMVDEFEGKSDAEIAEEARAKAVQQEHDDLLIAMQTRAKELKIRNSHTMGEETLARRIAEEEAELAKK